MLLSYKKRTDIYYNWMSLKIILNEKKQSKEHMYECIYMYFQSRQI